MLPPQQARDDSLRARLAQGRDAVTRASEFRACCGGSITRSEEHTSELQSDQISYAVFCLKKKKARRTRKRPSTGRVTPMLNVGVPRTAYATRKRTGVISTARENRATATES